MARKKPELFVAEDGKEFESEEEADRHNLLIAADRAFQSARKQYDRVLAESQMTADGEPFRAVAAADYWYVKDVFCWPELHCVSFYLSNFALNEHGQIELLEYHGRNHDLSVRHFRIADLYARDRNAKRALLKARTERLAELQEGVGKLEAELAEHEN